MASPKQMLLDERELIAGCIAGGRAAHTAFYERYREQVTANLMRVLNERNDLDDLVQEVFIIAFRGLARFRGDAKLSTWLYRICVNVALGRIRTKARRPHHIPNDISADVLPGATDHPERALQREQDKARVYRALEALSPKKRLVLFLHEIEGLELREIAYIVGANAVTVRTRLFYARKEFYALIAQSPAGEVK